MNTILKRILLFVCIVGMVCSAEAQKMNSSTFSGIKFRNIGPAFTSGRIADIAIHPENENVWYVAAKSFPILSISIIRA